MYASRSLLLCLVLGVLAAVVFARPIDGHARRQSICTRQDPPNDAAPVEAAAKASEATPDAASFDESSKSSPSSSQSSSSSSSSPNLKSAISTSTNVLSALFPVQDSLESWSTSPSASASLPLSDSTLRPNHLLSALSHDYIPAPDGKMAMRAHYPRGSYTFTHRPQGGLSFYAPGPTNVDVTTAKELTFGYSVFFEEGFDFNKGGKLPGMYGGNSAEGAISCSGGRRSSECFSARLMWRTDGKGEFYTYLPPFTTPAFAANKKQCDVPPESDCNPTYGASVGRGAFSFKTGQWTTVSERIKLNDVGQANGELELFVGGKSVISVNGLILRDSDHGRFRGIQMQTFFGGSDSSWASPRDQNAYFSDFSLAILDTF